jgi:NAD-dependent SIR2 family protein deacetylase
MNNVIFTDKMVGGMAFFDNLIQEINTKHIKKISKNPNHAYAELFNGTVYELKTASENVRGIKCDKAYISERLDRDVVEEIIKPCLCYSTLPIREQIVFY